MKPETLCQAARVYAAAVEAKTAYLRTPKGERKGLLGEHDQSVRVARISLLLAAKAHGSAALRADRRAVRG